MHPSNNPYRSFLIEASAGSGKTYQLSRRFLALVAAGSLPEHILTITFTLKSAAEMTHRILQYATHLWHDTKEQKSFDEALMGFYKESGYGVAIPPRSAVKSAELVLASSQNLKISTIDSLFYQWSIKFPWETQKTVFTKENPKVLSPSRKEALMEKVWDHLCKNHGSQVDFRYFLENRGIFDLKKSMDEMGSLQSHIQKLFLEEKNPLRALKELRVPDEESLFVEIEEDLRKVISTSSKGELYGVYVEKRDFFSLQELRLFNKDGSLNRSLIRSSKEDIQKSMENVEKWTLKFVGERQAKELYKKGLFFVNLFKKSLEYQVDFLNELGFWRYDDLTLGCYRLVHDPRALGAFWLIMKSFHHILIDEFQDTNALQWKIFEPISRELISGSSLIEEGLVPTVYMVGDRKQSIYGFREAYSHIWEEGYSLIEQSGERLELAMNYRSSPVLLKFINEVFSGWPKMSFIHRAAEKGVGEGLIPDQGEVRDLGYGETSEEEAELVASTLERHLGEEKERYPVWEGGVWRYLRPEDCAVLFRRGLNREVFARALRKRKIPVGWSGGKSFFQRPEIKDMRLLVDRLSGKKIFMSLGALEFLGESSFSVGRLPSEIFFEIYKRWGGIYEKSFGGVEGRLARERLGELVEKVCEWERRGVVSWGHLGEVWDEEAKEEEEEEVQWGVSLLTLHKAKGLEFPWVSVVETGDLWHRAPRYWMRENGPEGRISYIGLKKDQSYGDADWQDMKEREEVERWEESCRLLYVGLTRAKQYLFISGHGRREEKPKGFYSHLSSTIEKISFGKVLRAERDYKVTKRSKEMFSLELKVIEKNSIWSGEWRTYRYSHLLKEDLLTQEDRATHHGLLLELQNSKKDSSLWARYFKAISYDCYRDKIDSIKNSETWKMISEADELRWEPNFMGVYGGRFFFLKSDLWILKGGKGSLFFFVPPFFSGVIEPQGQVMEIYLRTLKGIYPQVDSACYLWNGEFFLHLG